MRIHSTGLGRGELIASQDKLIVKDGYLILSVRSTAPVHWHIRVLLDRRDVYRLVWSALKGPAYRWLLGLFRKPGPPPAEY